MTPTIDSRRTSPELWQEARRRRLVRLCAAITGDADAAEDLAQETLLEAWRNAHKLRDPAGADPWLAAIGRNVCRRWARRHAREATVVAADVEEASADVDLEVELERAELVELLDRALALLPAVTREVLVQRFIHDSPHAEIAARLGVSEDAVSMRLTRGKLVLRRVLSEELRGEAVDGGWSETRVWCSECGRHRLVTRSEPAPYTVLFRCPGCQKESVPGAVLSSANPVLARLLGDLVRPASILKRVHEWSARYFDADRVEVECTRCGRPVRLRPYVRDGSWPSIHVRGLYVHCDACGEEASSSLAALALARREVREFRREHPRVHALPVRTIERDGVDAHVVRYENLLGSRGIDLVFAGDTLRVLAVYGATA